MEEDAYIIAARALTLHYEARRFPKTARMAVAWLCRAQDWAQQNNQNELQNILASCLCDIPVLFSMEEYAGHRQPVRPKTGPGPKNTPPQLVRACSL